jgi:hypothetical protein
LSCRNLPTEKEDYNQRKIVRIYTVGTQSDERRDSRYGAPLCNHNATEIGQGDRKDKNWRRSESKLVLLEMPLYRMPMHDYCTHRHTGRVYTTMGDDTKKLAHFWGTIHTIIKLNAKVMRSEDGPTHSTGV